MFKRSGDPQCLSGSSRWPDWQFRVMVAGARAVPRCCVPPGTGDNDGYTLHHQPSTTPDQTCERCFEYATAMLWLWASLCIKCYYCCHALRHYYKQIFKQVVSTSNVTSMQLSTKENYAIVVDSILNIVNFVTHCLNVWRVTLTNTPTVTEAYLFPCFLKSLP